MNRTYRRPGPPLRSSDEDVIRALMKSEGNASAAARLLGLSAAQTQARAARYFSCERLCDALVESQGDVPIAARSLGVSTESMMALMKARAGKASYSSVESARKRYGELQDQWVRESHASGISRDDIAKILGVHQSIVAHTERRLGLSRRVVIKAWDGLSEAPEGSASE